MNFRQAAIKAAREAGKILLRYFGKDIPKMEKDDGSFVTKADIESINKIREVLLREFPSHDIIDEELGHLKKKSEYKWIIDPLDGTHNFIMNNPLFGVSIALQHKKEVVLGVIYFPVLKKLYYAEKGNGAFCNGKRINVSGENDIGKCIFVFDAKLKSRTDMKAGMLRKIAPFTWRIRIFGAAIYHNMLVAEGRIGFCIDFDSNPWDHSAALLVVEEAGGKATDLCGNKWSPETRDYIASNGKMHSRLLDVLKK